MSRCPRIAVAICTGVAILALWAGVAAADPAQFSRYQAEQVWMGAVTLPVAAHLEYRYALEAEARDERAAAETHLASALALWPRFPDAHFTLARLYLRRGNPDALYHAVQGVAAAITSFEGQRALVVNGAVTLAVVFILASAIVWIALAVRYFPFLAHRVAESLRIKFDAAASRASAYLLLLAPIAMLPGFATGSAIVLLCTWPFMQRRERVFAFVIAGMFATLAWYAPILDRYSTVANPNSLVSLVARANSSPVDESLIHALEAAGAPDLEAERQMALGMLASRGGDTEAAAAYFLRAISIKPDSPIAYVNLGNVYYLNGQYDKALEGYRKAERMDSTDAVGQYNLAQAYIKTLLMSESSQALARASQHGIVGVTESIAAVPRSRMAVYPRPFSNRDLWTIAFAEGRSHNPGVLSSAIASISGQSPRIAFWIVAGAMALALAMTRLVKRHGVAFQCANCGELTCDGCCRDDHGTVICQACSLAAAGVTSDRVIEALLRQRRQSVVVRRRRAIRWTTVWLPGIRHIFYGRLLSGMMVAALFSISVLMLWTRGFPLPDWGSLPCTTPLWKWILPAAGVVLSYWIAWASRQRYEVRNTRSGTPRRAYDSGIDITSHAGSTL